MQDSIVLTVFTPTYNREKLLENLYRSLCRQTSQNFEWLIVDDGSTDGTNQLIMKWIEEGKLKINYVYQKNAGKMQAHNNGVLKSSCELFVCVDSDDYLVDDAVECIINTWEANNITKQKDVVGILAYKGYEDGKMMGDGFFPQHDYLKAFEVLEEYKNGEMTMVFKTSVLKDYLFPKIEGEKFITEAWAYKQIDQIYKYFILPKLVTICEYREDGYTLNGGRNAYNNPIGMMYYEAVSIRCDKGIFAKIVSMIKYDMYKCISHSKDVDRFPIMIKLGLVLLYPIGFFYAMKKRKKYFIN